MKPGRKPENLRRILRKQRLAVRVKQDTGKERGDRHAETGSSQELILGMRREIAQRRLQTLRANQKRSQKETGDLLYLEVFTLSNKQARSEIGRLEGKTRNPHEEIVLQLLKLRRTGADIPAINKAIDEMLAD